MSCLMWSLMHWVLDVPGGVVMKCCDLSNFSLSAMICWDWLHLLVLSDVVFDAIGFLMYLVVLL